MGENQKILEIVKNIDVKHNISKYQCVERYIRLFWDVTKFFFIPFK